jgi:hypothetical protein
MKRKVFSPVSLRLGTTGIISGMTIAKFRLPGEKRK